MKDKKIAALNISALAAYEAMFGCVPQDMVAFVYDHIYRLDYFTPPEVIIKQARGLATIWLGRMIQKAEALEKAGNNTDKKPDGDASQ